MINWPIAPPERHVSDGRVAWRGKLTEDMGDEIGAADIGGDAVEDVDWNH
jgi:hypothetical protein